jgi:hypothetical protein
MNGIYALYMTGGANVTFGLFLLKDGVIAGADAGGGLYDGTFTVRPDGSGADGKVTLVVPPATTLITGSVSDDWRRLEVPLSLTKDFDKGQPTLIHTPTGPVNVIFRKLRDTP